MRTKTLLTQLCFVLAVAAKHVWIRKLQRACGVVALIAGVSLGAAGCSDQSLTSTEPGPAEFEVVASDGSRAVMRVAPGQPDSVVLVSVEVAMAPSSTTVPDGDGSLSPEGPTRAAIPAGVVFLLRLQAAQGAFNAIKFCGNTFWQSGFTWAAAERCSWEAAGFIAGQAAGSKLVPAVKVVPLRNSLYSAFRGFFTHRDLANVFNRSTKPSIQGIIHMLSNLLYDKLFNEIFHTIGNHR